MGLSSRCEGCGMAGGILMCCMIVESDDIIFAYVDRS